MKKNLFMALLAPVFLFGCQGVTPDDNETPGADTSDLKGTITLYTDHDIIMADGSYVAELTVLLTDNSGVEHDVTSDVEIYYEGNDNPLTSPEFKTSVEDEYRFYAVRGFDISNTVAVRAVKGVPALPEDSEADATDFRHRMMLIQYTGNECPNCPRLMDVLRKLAGDEAYASKYLHVASHSYNETDAAYSSAASTLARALNEPLYYPWLTFNLTTDEALDLAAIKAGIDELSKDVADAGIQASAALVGNTVYANVELKAAVSSKYRVAVWLLEDNIHSMQSGATASWQNLHDNCLRAMAGATKNESIYGKPIGTVEAGESYELIASIDMEPNWKAENCKLIIIAVAGNGNYDLVNCTVCPVGGSATYDYL
ncbi:MAG: Omp28-related outer membrane protein [Bacteroidales bacterium]|nr:Omp28-related outer membrane protein [Bacteroidales bacterium]